MEFVTVGPKVISVWTIKGKPNSAKNDLYLHMEKGSRGYKNDCSDNLSCVDINGIDTVTGAFDGTVQIFGDDNKLKNYKKLHSKSV